MKETDDTRDRVEELAEEFVERHRRGERPSVEEYASAHPLWADRIRKLFPAVLVLEGVKPGSSSPAEKPGGSSVGADAPPRQLGDFRIVRELGRGGMGVVYEAVQESLGRRVALKVLPESYSSSPQALRRFRREAQAAARLHHTNIVSVFGVGEQDGRHFYVMEYIEGRSLDRVFAELKRLGMDPPGRNLDHPSESRDDAESFEDEEGLDIARALLAGKRESASQPSASRVAEDEPSGKAASGRGNEPAPAIAPPLRGAPSGAAPSVARRGPGSAYWRSVADIGVQAALALDYAHKQGTLHRDVKPGNLMLDKRRTVWITDFGLAKLADQEDLTQTGDVVGTLRYMAPEQLEGRTDARTDVYALGLTLYELLTLRPAFDATSRHELLRRVGLREPPAPRTIVPDIPHDLETIVLKAIAREPAHRYQTAGDLADDLQRFLEDRPIRARRTSALEHGWRWCRRNPALAGLSAAAVLLLVALAIGMSMGYVMRTQALKRESQLRAEAQEEGRRAEANLQLAAEAFDDVFAKLSGAPEARILGETTDALWYSTPAVVSRKDAAVLSSLMEFYERFAEQNRDSRRWQHETALAFRRVGDIQQLLGRLDDAEAAYRRAVEFFERLRAEDPDRAEYLAGLAGVHNELGRIAQDRGEFDGAGRETRLALDLLGGGDDALPAATGTRFELARSYYQLGFLDLMRRFGPDRPPEPDSGDRDDGTAHTLRALAILEELAADEPGNGEYRLFMARCHGHLWGASRFAEESDRPERRAAQAGHAEAAIALLERLVDDFPENPHYRAELALTYALTGPMPSDGATEDADERVLGRAERAVALAEKLSETFPEVPHYRGVLAICSLYLANRQWAGGQAEAAVERAHRAVELSRALLDESPARGRSRGLFARALHAAIRAHELRGEAARARPLLEEMIELESAQWSGEPTSSPFTIELADAYALLARILGELNEPERAAEAARKAAALKPPAPEQPRPMRFGPLDARLGES